jgi:membrane-bound ClpP family serine protease
MVVIPHLMRNPLTPILDSRFRGNDNLSVYLWQSTIDGSSLGLNDITKDKIMGWWLALAVVLYLLFVVLIIAEVFIPSGGLITICALACLIGGTYIFFKQSTTAGIAGVIFGAIAVPVILRYVYRELPNTRFGKTVMLAPPERQKGDAVPDTPEIKELLGAVGTVLTPLRPVGMCDFSGRRVECMAESGYVGKGNKVRVIDVESTQLTVRLIEET